MEKQIERLGLLWNQELDYWNYVILVIKLKVKYLNNCIRLVNCCQANNMLAKNLNYGIEKSFRTWSFMIFHYYTVIAKYQKYIKSHLKLWAAHEFGYLIIRSNIIRSIIDKANNLNHLIEPQRIWKILTIDNWWNDCPISKDQCVTSSDSARLQHEQGVPELVEIYRTVTGLVHLS